VSADRTNTLPGVRHTFHHDSGSCSYRVAHPSAGESQSPVLFIHGWGMNSDASWCSVLQELGTGFIAVDLPGFGDSRRAGRFTWEAAALSVLSALDHAGFEQVHVVAHSMGGPVAATLIELAPQRVLSFTAVASTLGWERRRTHRFVYDLTSSAVNEGLRFFDSGTVSLRRRSTLRARSVSRMLSRPPQTAALRDSVSLLKHLQLRDWSGVAFPHTTWVVPSRDTILPARWQYESAALCGAEVLEVPRLGHNFFIDHPQLLVEHIKRRA
jgi:pimeloyl-ACP methyl ester carboxylesterase